MSTRTIKAKLGAPKKKVTKARQNICVHPAILKAGKRAAAASALSFSKWIERLILNQAKG